MELVSARKQFKGRLCSLGHSTEEVAGLVDAAAQCSQAVYGIETPVIRNCTVRKDLTAMPSWNGSEKAYALYTVRPTVYRSRTALVVAVRGSLGIADWLVNFDNELSPCADILVCRPPLADVETACSLRIEHNYRREPSSCPSRIRGLCPWSYPYTRSAAPHRLRRYVTQRRADYPPCIHRPLGRWSRRDATVFSLSVEPFSMLAGNNPSLTHRGCRGEPPR